MRWRTPAPNAPVACSRGPEHGGPGGAAGGPGGGWGGAGGTAWRVSNASIVSLIPGGTEILFALGLGSRRGPPRVALLLHAAHFCSRPRRRTPDCY